MTRHTPMQNTADELLATKLAIEKAKLAKLEADLPAPTPKYMRYEDLPPPSPEERERLIARMQDLYDSVNRQAKKEEREWYLSMVDFAP